MQADPQLYMLLGTLVGEWAPSSKECAFTLLLCTIRWCLGTASKEAEHAGSRGCSAPEDVPRGEVWQQEATVQTNGNQEGPGLEGQNEPSVQAT